MIKNQKLNMTFGCQNDISVVPPHKRREIEILLEEKSVLQNVKKKMKQIRVPNKRRKDQP